MLEKLKKNKSNLSKKKQFFLIFLIFSFHLIGIISSLFRPKKDVDFHLTFHLLRFFSWWSVHASILTVLVAILEKKKVSSYFSQLLILVATVYNLVTFCFISTYFLRGKIQWMWKTDPKLLWLDLQLFSWHFVAPFLTIFYFYFYAQIDKLKEKLTKIIITLSLALAFPTFYFLYDFILAKVHRGNPEGSLFPYMKKYPYYIFERIGETRWWLIINFLIAALIFISLCLLMIWTKNICDKKLKKLT
jgi:hypothetical protein